MQVAYVSGRYRARTIFGVIWNIWKARQVAIRYWRKGYAVICPHQNSLLFDGKCPDETWLAGDVAFIRRLRPHVDCIVMMQGWQESDGARHELAMAIRRGVNVLYDGVGE